MGNNMGNQLEGMKPSEPALGPAKSFEIEKSGEALFEVTDIEQLKKEYKFSLWPMTAQEADEARASGELDKKLKDATMKAGEIIKQKGGLTFGDLETLGFFRDGDSRHYTDI